MTQQEFNKAVKLHQKWLRKEKDGEQFRLKGEDFVDIIFSEANLQHAELIECDFIGSNMRNVDLSFAFLERCDFSFADLNRAQFFSSQILSCCFRQANMQMASLACSSVYNTSFYETDFSFAYLNNTSIISSSLLSTILQEAEAYGTNFSCSKLSGAKFDNMHYDTSTSFFAPVCPEEGSFIAFKKCRGDRIVKLLIPEDAKRSSGTTRKCRCSKAKVLEITNAFDETVSYGDAVSCRDNDFIYRVGEEVKVSNFDDDRWVECSSGIHFFITRDEAVNFNVM